MRAAIYCRLSEEDRSKTNANEDSESISNQKSLLKEYAGTKGWEIYGIYSDDDYTGSDRSRPQFNRLINDAKEGKFDVILCKSQSRFTRELELVERYIHGLFPLWGIRFVSLTDNADTDNKGNKKSRQINGLVNEWYLEDMSENIKSVLDNKRKMGLHIGAFALYGYKKDSQSKGKIVVDRESADVVKEIFVLYSCGYGKTAIAELLNQRGVPNPTEYKRQKGYNYKQGKSNCGTLWHYSTVSGILSNEMYIGNMVQGKYGSVSYKVKANKPRPKESWFVVENTHEAIIERQLWDSVQDKLKSKAKPAGTTGRIGMFSKKAYCGYCGYALRSVKSRGKEYLRCPNRLVSKSACEGAFVSVKELESRVCLRLRELSSEYLDLDKLAGCLNERDDTRERIKRLESRLEGCNRDIKSCIAALSKAYLDFAEGEISAEVFNELSCSIQQRRKSLNDSGFQVQNEICRLRESPQTGDTWKQVLESRIASLTLSRRAVEIFADRIEVFRRCGGEKNVPLSIYWSF